MSLFWTKTDYTKSYSRSGRSRDPRESTGDEGSEMSERRIVSFTSGCGVCGDATVPN